MRNRNKDLKNTILLFTHCIPKAREDNHGTKKIRKKKGRGRNQRGNQRRNRYGRDG